MITGRTKEWYTICDYRIGWSAQCPDQVGLPNQRIGVGLWGQADPIHQYTTWGACTSAAHHTVCMCKCTTTICPIQDEEFLYLTRVSYLDPYKSFIKSFGQCVFMKGGICKTTEVTSDSLNVFSKRSETCYHFCLDCFTRIVMFSFNLMSHTNHELFPDLKNP